MARKRRSARAPGDHPPVTLQTPQLMWYRALRLDDLGPVGGWVALVAGAALVVLGLLGPMRMIFFGLLLGGGGVFAIQRARLRPRGRAGSATSDDELAGQLAARPLPFALCLRCRAFDAPPDVHRRCPRCDAAVDYLIVEHDAERSTAAAAAGLPLALPLPN